ncbi:MAG: PQQ-dependent sugar dehydrogenase [Nitrososphaera sp.]
MERVKTIALLIGTVAAAAAGISLLAGLNENLPQVPRTDDSKPKPVENGGSNTDTFTVLPDPNPPKLNDPNLRVEKVITGLDSPTGMAFLDPDDLLVLEKNSGLVRLVSNGSLQTTPVLSVKVVNNSERGLLGIAVAEDTSETTIFLYYTESSGSEVRNRVYRYDWSGLGEITGGTLVLDLPATPGPNHDGGKLTLGPDGMLYAMIGDLNRNGVLQNFKSGPEPDDTSVILRVDMDGNPAVNAILSHTSPEFNSSLSSYYAYGIRNGFGLDFDPGTGLLWDTENGPADYDEINVVRPGFNSGWERVIGPMERTGIRESDLVLFEGSHYADPAFSWRQAIGLTDIEFFNSTSLGGRYSSNLFVGDFNNGNLYFFTLNQYRDGLALGDIDNAGLSDLVADGSEEVASVTFGAGFGGITDIETGPDGHLYVLSLSGNLYRIVPQEPATS